MSSARVKHSPFEKPSLTTTVHGIPQWIVHLHNAILDGEALHYDATDKEACAIFLLRELPQNIYWKVAPYPSIRDAVSVQLVYSRENDYED